MKHSRLILVATLAGLALTAACASAGSAGRTWQHGEMAMLSEVLVTAERPAPAVAEVVVNAQGPSQVVNEVVVTAERAPVLVTEFGPSRDFVN
jgi:hypothetical protein